MRCASRCSSGPTPLPTNAVGRWFSSLGRTTTGRRGDLLEARRRVDAALEQAERETMSRRSDLRHRPQPWPPCPTLTRPRAAAAVGRLDFAVDPGQRGTEIVSRWFKEATRIIDEVQSRLTLLQERPQEPALRAEAVLRTYGGILSESIARNQAFLTGAQPRWRSSAAWNSRPSAV